MYLNKAIDFYFCIILSTHNFSLSTNIPLTENVLHLQYVVNHQHIYFLIYLICVRRFDLMFHPLDNLEYRPSFNNLSVTDQ